MQCMSNKCTSKAIYHLDMCYFLDEGPRIPQEMFRCDVCKKHLSKRIDNALFKNKFPLVQISKIKGDSK